MTITALALTNPGAETGDTSGWTFRSGGAQGVITAAGHSGTHYFVATSSGTTAKWDQQIDVSAYAAAIDADNAAVTASAWHFGFSGDSDSGALYVEFYDISVVLLARQENVQTDPSAWTHESVSFAVPPNTRYIRVGTNNVRHGGTELSSYWDDFALTITDNRNADYPGIYRPKASQLGAYSVVNQNKTTGDAPVKIMAHQAGAYTIAQRKAEQAYILQGGAVVLVQEQTSTGLFKVFAFEIGAYALVKARAGRRELRAYTFPQDDHDFYVLNLGVDKTFVVDMQTEQWSTWRSDSINCWRPADGLAWDQDNVGGDYIEGLIWSIDADGTLDDAISGDEGDQVPIVSVLRGMYPQRLRNALGCYRAVLTASQGAPAAPGVGISLRTSIDFGDNWNNHGFLLLDQPGKEYDIAWVSLGLITAPGMIFEITDTGYARRIEALDIDLGPDEGRVTASGNYGNG